MPDYFCKHPEIKWNIVKGDEINLINYISKYHLICANHTIISSFGMFYFGGFGLGSMFFPTLSDRNGRKWYFVCSMVIIAGSTLAIMFMPDASVTELAPLH